MTSEKQDEKKRADYFVFTASELAIEIYDSLAGAAALVEEADVLHSKADDLYVEAHDLETRARECMARLVELLWSGNNAADFEKGWIDVLKRLKEDRKDP